MSNDVKPGDLTEVLYAAVNWALNRIQTDPEFRWHMIGTETFDRLIAAEAAYTGRDPVDVRHERHKDLQPEYRRRRPECSLNRDRVSDLELLLERNGIEVPPKAR